MRRRRAAPSLRARVLPGHAVEGDAALRRLPLARQLRPREPGLSSWAGPSRPSSRGGRTLHSAPRPRAPRRLRRSPRRPQVRKQETWGFPAYGMGIGLWLMISSLPRRRLVLNHTRGVYHFSIQGRTVCQGPMHLVYVRLALSSDGDAPGGQQMRGLRAREGKPCGVGRAGQAGPCPVPKPPSPLPRAPELSRLPLASLQKVLLPAGSVRPQVGAASAGAAVRALRANGISGSSHRPEAQH
ncbi:transmembrane protein 249 isoform X1 [Camelus ferus]|uniref:Transmembrane protein 249 isoform X1 n=1 Tax=Camelus ferus TaxID=419612 RepID=A0A8B8S1V5_CAMFR|nr:transmembrane protein 249 isoform X1 [Camelus ferus]